MWQYQQPAPACDTPCASAARLDTSADHDSLLGLLLVALWLTIVPPLVRAATAPGQPVQSLARAALPGGDLASAVLPAQAGRDGEVALW